MSKEGVGNIAVDEACITFCPNIKVSSNRLDTGVDAALVHVLDKRTYIDVGYC